MSPNTTPRDATMTPAPPAGCAPGAPWAWGVEVAVVEFMVYPNSILQACPTIRRVSEHYENFPVASLLCPPRLRPPIAAIYGFARTADDIADEGAASAAQRLEALAQ